MKRNAVNGPSSPLRDASARDWGTWALVLAILALAIVGLSALRARSMPSFQGKTLARWLLQPDAPVEMIPNDLYGHIHDELWERLVNPDPSRTAQVGVSPDPARTSPEEPLKLALDEMGTNSLPLLLDWIVSRPTAWERARGRAFQFLPVRVQMWILFRGFSLDPEQNRRAAAMRGFMYLGRRAEPALASLSNLLFHVEPCLEVASAISATGPQGSRLLVRAVEEGPPHVREWAAYSLGIGGGGGQEEISALISAMERGDFGYQVLGALGRLNCQDPRITAAIVRRLESGEEFTPFRMELLLLGLQGEDASAAAPELIRRYLAIPKNGRADDRTLLRRVIQTVAPQEVFRLGVPPADESGDQWP